MLKIKTSHIRDLLVRRLPCAGSFIFTNAIDRNSDMSIGVFSAPESRASNSLTFGGDIMAPVTRFSVNILVHWTDKSDVCEDRANDVYKTIKDLGQNFYLKQSDPNSIKIAFARLLDSQPIWIGRDSRNICEYSIRVDFFYYH